MHAGTSSSRPTVAHALELALRGSKPVSSPAVAVTSTDEGASSSVPDNYFDPGDFADEQDWWTKQLSGR
jgi:hypothetical protein